MKTLKFLKRDIRLGLVNRSFLLVIAVLFAILTGLECSNAIEATKHMNYMWSNGTVMDYYFFSLQGSNYYRFDPQNEFLIPLSWFIYQMGISYFIAYYSEKDFSENGKIVLLAGRSRSSWWLAKMIWCILSVVAYYVVEFVSCIVFALFKGADLSWNITDDFYKAYFGYNMTYISYKDLIFIAVAVPMAITIGISLVQLLMSFVVSPVTSFAATCGLYVVSTYYTAWFLPGSFAMWLRSSYYTEEGLNPLSGILIAVFLVVAVFLLGREYFERKDII